MTASASSPASSAAFLLCVGMDASRAEAVAGALGRAAVARSDWMEAVEAARTERPGAVLINAEAPAVDVPGLLGALGELVTAEDVPVVVLEPMAAPATEALRWRDMGAQVLPAGLQPHTLAAHLQAMLSRQD